MGGEKLKAAAPYLGLLITLICFSIAFFGINVSIQAQEQVQTQVIDETASPETTPNADDSVNESELIIGETPDSPVQYSGSSILVMLRMILVLALAALAIYGVVFLVKRMAKPVENRDPYLKVLARVPLGSDSFAAVISLGPKAYLVGGGSGGLNVISEVDDTETLETMLIDEANRSADSSQKSFLNFRALLGRFPKPARLDSSHADDLRKQRERLKGL